MTWTGAVLTLSVTSDLGDNVDLLVLRVAIDAVVTPAILTFSLDGDTVTAEFASEPVSGERDAADAEAVTHAAGAVQRERDTKNAEINTRTAELAEAGTFAFAAKTFPTDIGSQRYYEGLMAGRDTITYPVVIDTSGDLDDHSLANATALDGLIEACVDAVRAIEDGGTTLKASVRAAGTVAAVRAITDNR